MSGGVDSSVAACLLAETGYEVVGSQMKLLHDEGLDHGCCGPTAERDARSVAETAGFPFETIDLSDTFRDTVLTDFFDEHAVGRTPNPCARCNEHIKFSAFLDRADELGTEFVATGHYVRAERDGRGAWHLRRGADRSKDQSYMLHMLGQDQLARSLFPVGDLPKTRTRELARRFGLERVMAKPDSQEVCFVADADHGSFIEREDPSLVRRGEMVDAASGRVVGEHDGTFRFTIGQRRGLGVTDASQDKRYVIDMDGATGRVVIGPGELLARRGLVADRMHWIAGGPPAAGPFEAEARIRYRGNEVAAVVEPAPDGGSVTVEFRSPQRAVAPGQSVVFYRDDEVLGGGRIVDALH